MNAVNSKVGPICRNSEKLINAINKYGRRKLSEETEISRVMINQVCINWRSFGIGNAFKVGKVLGLPFLDCIDQRGVRYQKELVESEQVRNKK